MRRRARRLSLPGMARPDVRIHLEVGPISGRAWAESGRIRAFSSRLTLLASADDLRHEGLGRPPTRLRASRAGTAAGAPVPSRPS